MRSFLLAAASFCLAGAFVPALRSQEAPSDLQAIPAVPAQPELIAEPLYATVPPRCVWLGAEYLLWWRKPVCLKPPLITVGLPSAGPGGQPVLGMGGSRFEFPGAVGVRPFAGVAVPGLPWLTLEAEGLYLQEIESFKSFRSPANAPASFLVFQNPDTTTATLPFTIPGVVEGSSEAVGRSFLWGVEANAAAAWSVGDAVQCRTAVLVGGRYLNLSESIEVTNFQRLVADPSVRASGAALFETRNQFAGPQVGVRLGVAGRRWSLDTDAKLAVGNTRLSRTISGYSVDGPPVLPGVLPGPFLAQPSNIGTETHTMLTLVPDFSVKARFQVTDYISVMLGYRLLYWNRILCPGDQMDPRLNITQLPGFGPRTGPGLPAKEFLHTDFFAQGLDAGLELRF